MISQEQCRAAHRVVAQLLARLQAGNVAAAEAWILPGGITAADIARDLGPSLAGSAVHTVVRVLVSDGNLELVGLAILELTPAERIAQLAVIDGPRPAYVLAAVETRDGWRVWGKPARDSWRQGRKVDLAQEDGGELGRPN